MPTPGRYNASIPIIQPPVFHNYWIATGGTFYLANILINGVLCRLDTFRYNFITSDPGACVILTLNLGFALHEYMRTEIYIT